MVLALYARSLCGSPAFGELADQGYHLELGRAFAEAWRAGDLPPTWSASANGGRGSPVFVLYPPLFCWLTAGWMSLVGPSPEALRCSVFTTALFNFLSIYWAACGWLSRPRASAAAGLALLMPGVTFVALGRGMFPNFLALGWTALAVGAGQRALARRHYGALLALAGAALILSHTPTAYLAALLGATLTTALWARSRPGAVLRTAFAGVAAVLATAWFWAPMLVVARQAQTGYLAEAHPYAASLWLSSRPASTPFEQDWAFLNETAALLGGAQLLLAAGLIWASPRGPLRRCLAVAVAWIVLASVWPTGVWLTALPGYESVQFCWRWQPLLSLGCALAFASLPFGGALRLAPVVAVVVGLFLPMTAPSDRGTARTASLASNLIEMRPLGAGRELFPPGAAGRVEALSAGCRVETVDVRPSSRAYRVFAEGPCRLRAHTYHFPGWRATADGTQVPIRSEPETALQLIDVPPGSRLLEVRYAPLEGRESDFP